jgi:hypothetical protein
MTSTKLLLQHPKRSDHHLPYWETCFKLLAWTVGLTALCLALSDETKFSCITRKLTTSALVLCCIIICSGIHFMNTSKWFTGLKIMILFPFPTLSWVENFIMSPHSWSIMSSAYSTMSHVNSYGTLHDVICKCSARLRINMPPPTNPYFVCLQVTALSWHYHPNRQAAFNLLWMKPTNSFSTIRKSITAIVISSWCGNVSEYFKLLTRNNKSCSIKTILISARIEFL